jgi:hypothetical protein
MHILIGLVVATVLVIGWAAGNLFACVFLSLPTGALGLYSLLFINTGAGFLGVLACAAVLCGIWAPYGYRRGWFKQASADRVLRESIRRNPPTKYGHDIVQPLRLEVSRRVAD